MSRVSCQYLADPKRYSALEIKMGRGGQDELAGKSGITSDEKKGGVVSCGPFPIPWRGRNARYPRCSRTCNIFCILFAWEPHFVNRVPNFPACSATVVDTSAMRGRAGAGKQLSSCGRLELSMAGMRKEDESAAEGRECLRIREMARI